VSLVVVGVGVLALQVDDWGRDLRTNVAETAPDAADTLLRPVTVASSVEQAAALVEQAAATIPRLRASSRLDSPDEVRLSFVHTTKLFRFKDDVTVWVEQVSDGARIRARSASRVGTGDLGQNPRTLRALFRAVREQAGARPR
jgi:uncharacterized protein (DUF1499 family)